MVFDSPQSVEQFGSTELAWTQVFAGKDPAGGDALFVERDRDDGNLLFLLVDATGHGQKASVAIEDMQEFLRLADPINHSASELLKRLHGFATQARWSDDIYFDAVAVVINEDVGLLHSSRAGGIPYLILGRPGSSWCEWRFDGAPPLGALHRLPVEQQECSIFDKWVLMMTDGITETGVQSGHPLYGTGPLSKFLNGLPSDTRFASLPSLIQGDNESYDSKNWPADDITVACLAVRPQGLCH